MKNPDFLEMFKTRDLYGLYRELAKDGPLYSVNEKLHLVLGYDLCFAIVKKPDTFLSAVTPLEFLKETYDIRIIDAYVDYLKHHCQVLRNSCSTSDPPRHTVVRQILNPFFAKERLAELAPFVSATVRRLLGEMQRRQETDRSAPVDFVGHFSRPLPVRVICELMDLPDLPVDKVVEWTDSIVEPFGLAVDREAALRCARTLCEAQAFFRRLLEGEKDNRFVSELTRVADRVQEENGDYRLDAVDLLTILIIDFLASGNETTTSALSAGMLLLALDEALFDTLSARPELVPNFTEEVLRLESPAQGMFRKVAEDCEVLGYRFRKGDFLNLRFGAANRDERRFECPHEVVLERKHPGRHLAFGAGRHTCVGAPLARLELNAAFGEIVRTFRSCRLACAEEEVPYQTNFFGRNISFLPLYFS